MKLTVAFILFLFSNAHCWGRGDLEKYGPFQIALRSNLIKCEHDRTLNLDVSGIDVYFYDFPRNDVETFTIDGAARGILAIKELDKTRRFIIFVGGYKSNINKRTEEIVRDTFRNYPNSYLIILDHSPYTNDNQGQIKSYERSVKYVHYIGKALAQMLADLKAGGISPKNMHCIGHSLGSQILGNTGEIFLEKTGTKIDRITALDPAGPCFSNSLIQEQVRSGVADYVEVYHCNAGGLGSTSVLGDIDFFVNKKGQSQPNCKTPFLPGIFDSSKAAKCNHRACIDIWTATVSNPNWYLALKCDSYKKFKKGRCAGNDVTIAGFWNPGNATGVYYFSTDGYDI
ncbi:pancreatic triacylglycerol lipase [Bicyclus anynana]|uniref:Pancreatic triacylglycerol lipase n=1 Tax=Bicyclus anynana TaxID=110368 RepID=A0A6J1MQD9_BICAN|nr:pancreatic triacylglycerol lipase [Bicyclus anynana]